MKITFWKYHGAGNDFILLDQRETVRIKPGQAALIAKLCHRHFGIGADGLISIERSKTQDFKMVYFNSDGNQGSFCGNGARCAVQLARKLSICSGFCRFEAMDGVHEASIDSESRVHLKMADVHLVHKQGNAIILNTGSPHYVQFIESIENIDLIKEAHEIRYNPRFKIEGINVNFAEFRNETLYLRTYERGVEDETLSCGTGVTATALAASLYTEEEDGTRARTLMTHGGKLEVKYQKTGQDFQNIQLIGPAEEVFEGIFSLSP